MFLTWLDVVKEIFFFLSSPTPQFSCFLKFLLCVFLNLFRLFCVQMASLTSIKISLDLTLWASNGLFTEKQRNWTHCGCVEAKVQNEYYCPNAHVSVCHYKRTNIYLSINISHLKPAALMCNTALRLQDQHFFTLYRSCLLVTSTLSARAEQKAEKHYLPFKSPAPLPVILLIIHVHM